MTEGEFVRYYKKRNHLKNHKEAKEKIDLLWEALLKALGEGKKISLKNWGAFECKEVKPRKILTPKMSETAYTKGKKTIKFRAGSGLQDIVNGAGSDE